ncbi:Hypothetical predicted protein [Mytilus galloprovincialis]|uniref:Uncharacterized protein n=1 Tax=Mytilus galloprovincialis TaxID=29158 RepID=A0A8B6F7U6_MYTGA|nr:Hypothetical predicted protein [Mytilus galloprovincialis]
MAAVSFSSDCLKTKTSNISPGKRWRTDGFDDIRPTQPVSEEHDYHTYDLMSTEIQDEPRVKGCLLHFLTFAGETITNRYAGEKIKQHSRVVRTSWTPKADMQLGTIVKVKKSRKEVLVQWDKIEEKVNLLDLRLVAATEKTSRVVLMSQTIIPSSTVSGMQVGKNVNLRLLDNAPIKKIEQVQRVVKKSWIPKEEMPIGTIVMVKTLKREVDVQWDQIEENVDLHNIRLESNQHCAEREKEEGARVVKIARTSEDKSCVGTIVKANKTKQTARVLWNKLPEEKVKLSKLRLVGNYLIELNAVEAAKKEEKERKKREKTAIVGDIGAMGDALPTIELLMKKSSNINSDQKEQKKRGIATEKKRKKQMMEDISIFKQILDHPAYKENPTETITTHLQNKLKQEDAG